MRRTSLSQKIIGELTALVLSGDTLRFLEIDRRRTAIFAATRCELPRRGRRVFRDAGFCARDTFCKPLQMILKSWP